LAVPFYLDPLTRSSLRDMVRSNSTYSGTEFDEEFFNTDRRVWWTSISDLARLQRGCAYAE
jgi:hypothetical protein